MNRFVERSAHVMYDLFYSTDSFVDKYVHRFILGRLNDGNEIVKSGISFLNIHAIDVLPIRIASLCSFFSYWIPFELKIPIPSHLLYPSVRFICARTVFSIHKSRCAFDHLLCMWRTSRKSSILHTQWSRIVRLLVANSREAEALCFDLWFFFLACVSL